MITKLTTAEELQNIIIETIINKTQGSVNKVSPNSVLSGISYGLAKVAQKTLKEVALIESINFPDSASGAMLDVLADKLGIPPRYGSSSSSTYIRLVADPGTVYNPLITTFRTSSGITFQLQNSVTIGPLGYNYALVSSTTQGDQTNVNPATINQVVAAPTGHIYVINEYASQGGRDQEDDFLFRKRIKEGANFIATGTLSTLEQAFNRINNRVLRTFYYGLNTSAKVVIGVASQNGEDFSQIELDEMLEEGEKFFSIAELRPFTQPQVYGIELRNVQYKPIDISFRVDLLQNADPDLVRIDIQTRISKLFDYRNWKYDRKVEWDDLLEVVKNTRGVRYVPDQNFSPREDIMITDGQLPRFRGFRMLDLQGNIIVDNQNNLNPIFYPFPADYKLQTTILRDL